MFSTGFEPFSEDFCNRDFFVFCLLSKLPHGAGWEPDRHMRHRLGAVAHHLRAGKGWKRYGRQVASSDEPAPPHGGD